MIYKHSPTSQGAYTDLVKVWIIFFLQGLSAANFKEGGGG